MNKLKEEWKPIKGYEGLYEVSNCGRVKSLKRKFVSHSKNGKEYEKETKEKILKTYLSGDKKQYEYIKLMKKPFSIHRLVAEAFIPNDDNKHCVDHIDTDTLNNNVENLKWVTPKENSNNPLTRKHSKNNPLISKKVYQYSLNDKLIMIWESMHEAERNGYGRKEIKNVSIGKQKIHKGYKWSFEPL